MKKIVIGLGFGDEGKGLVVDWLASMNPKSQVVRYSGGHQVGHCVRFNGDTHIFSNFGSGTMRGLQTIWNAKTCDPVAFCKEYKDIKQYGPVIKINPLCAITTPFEKITNIKSESVNNHGSIGCGFGATIQREDDNYHLYFQDVFYTQLMLAKLDGIEKYYSRQNVFISKEQRKDFIESCHKMSKLTDKSIGRGEIQIYESSQGLMLDMDYGIFPNVTRSKVGTQEIDLTPDDEIYLVTRAYQTRHGNGWCSRHGFKPNAPNETNKENEFQGEFRTRLLDLDLINYAMTIDRGVRTHKNVNLVITCLDHMNNYALTNKEERKDFSCEESFVDYIIDNIPQFSKCFVSHGPTASDISEY